jgi:NADH-quinone oxidoreductase subunit K
MLNYFLFLLISFVMFAVGAYGLLTRRNMIRMLVSAEVMFNAGLLAILVLAANTAPVGGGIIALMAIGVSAAEIGVLMSVGILFFRSLGEMDVYELASKEERSDMGGL